MWLPQDNNDEGKLFDRIRRILRNLKCELEGTPTISDNQVRFQVKDREATQTGANNLKSNFRVAYAETNYVIDVKVDDGPGGYFVVTFS